MSDARRSIAIEKETSNEKKNLSFYLNVETKIPTPNII